MNQLFVRFGKIRLELLWTSSWHELVKELCLTEIPQILWLHNKGPVWIHNDDWNQMIKEIWSTPEFQRRSKSTRNNRLTETDGKLSTHSGCTVSFASYRASMMRIVYICYNGLQIFIFIFSNIFFWLIAKKTGGKEPLWDGVFSVLPLECQTTWNLHK